jgi:hypothetical protein
MNRILLLLLFVGLLNLAKAQENIFLYGKVVKGSTPLFNATIYNNTANKGTVSDNYGDFSITVQPSDVIKISSIGFKTIYYTVPDTLTELKFRILVNMVEDTVLLKEAVVVPWPVNRSMLKKAMLDNKKEKDQIGAYAGFVSNDKPVEEPAAKLSNPVSFIYEKFSKKARQQKKMEQYRRMIEEGERIPSSSDKPTQY